jgi:hypothetical protein
MQKCASRSFTLATRVTSLGFKQATISATDGVRSPSVPEFREGRELTGQLWILQDNDNSIAHGRITIFIIVNYR